MDWLIAIQRWLYGGIAEGMRSTADLSNLPTLMAVAFLFGIVHAFMPGHGKSVLVSYHLGRPGRLMEGVATDTLLAWNESMDYCLSRNADGTYSAYPFFQPADIRFVSPTLRFANQPFKLWLKQIEASDPNLAHALDWIDRVNSAVFRKFDETYDG